MKTVVQFLRQTWNVLRRLSGDDAYECYLDHLKRHHPDAKPLNRRSFFLSEQQRRWNGGPNRCC
ncbi:MAG TPA: YbdD/YjiX family protein [Gammaproteobacteria bacterium]